jgi:hypothetical protein
MDNKNHTRDAADSHKLESIENQHNLNERLLQNEYEEEEIVGVHSNHIRGGGIQTVEIEARNSLIQEALPQ